MMSTLPMLAHTSAIKNTAEINPETARPIGEGGLGVSRWRDDLLRRSIAAKRLSVDEIVESA